MKESERLRKENDKLQAEIEQKLRDINQAIENINKSWNKQEKIKMNNEAFVLLGIQKELKRIADALETSNEMVKQFK